MIKAKYLMVLTRLGTDGVSTLLVTFSLFAIGFIAYVLQFILGRVLSVEGFGDFNALLSLLALLTFFANVLGLAIVKVFSELYSDKNYTMLHELFNKAYKFSLLLGVCIGLLLVLLRGPIEEYFNLSSIHLVLFFSLSFSLSLAATFFSFFFQGISSFVYFSIYIIQGGLTRLFFPLCLIFFVQKDPSMVYLGFFLSQVLSLIVGMYLYERSKRLDIQVSQSVGVLRLSSELRRILVTSLPIMVITGVMTLLANTDLLLVKTLFSSYDAGIYAGVLTMGKVILFGAGSVTTVMYPRMVAAKKDMTNVYRKAASFMTLQMVFILIPLVVFFFYPTLVTSILFGSKYLPSIPYVPMYSVYISLWVMINFMLTLFIALDMKKFTYVLPIFAVLQLFGIKYFGDTLLMVVNINILIASFLLVFCMTYFFFRAKKTLNLKNGLLNTTRK